MRRYCLSFILIVTTMLAQAGTLPSSVHIHYDVLLGGKLKVGRAEQIWQLEEQHYTLETRVKPILFGPDIRYISHGRMGPHGLIPDDYAEFRNKDATPRVSAHFDWPAEHLHFGDGNNLDHDEKLVRGIQDINAFLFQLSFMGSNRDPVEMTLFVGRKVKQYDFSAKPDGTGMLGERKIVTRIWQSQDNDGKTEVWLAPELGNLPVRFIRQDDSKELWLVANKIEIDTP